MSGFVTYAQNFEDLMIWRAVHDVAAGFYIDVGAADPDEDSVTRAFYDRGWRGVNVEPSPDHFAALSAARPRDINLSCLLGASPGETRLYSIADTGLSTIKRSFATRHAAEGYLSEAIMVPVRTLSDVCGEYAPPDIHFLKIDVEGAERDVLAGADFSIYRPWIVLLEATEPMSQVENWADWEPLLTAADYGFVWFDGLNRFYLAAEQRDRLLHAFQTPPNVFDGWVKPRGQQDMLLLKRASAAEAAMGRLREEADRARAAADVEAAAGRAEAHAARTEATTARAEAGAVRSAQSAAEQDAAAARIEASGLRGALVIAQQATEAARGEAATRQASEAALRNETATLTARLSAQEALLSASVRDATAAHAEADRLADQLATSRQETSASRAENAGLRLALAETRSEAHGAQVEIHRLAGVEQARDQAEAMLRALYASTSWKFAAPLRVLSRATRLFGLGAARRQRLRRVATLGGSNGRIKGLGRIMIYILGRAGARIPGGRLIRHFLPGFYKSLNSRYIFYFQAADAPSDPPPLAGGFAPAPQMHDVSSEEQEMRMRLSGPGALA